MSLPFDKSSIRTALLRRREQLDCHEVERLGAVAQARLLELPAFQDAETLALYSPIRNEVATGRVLAAALAVGKRVCYPCVLEDRLHFFQVVSDAELRVGCFGVCEPDRRAPEIDPSQIEFLLVPGVAFDRRGFRLGYGRGYFDRMLCNGCFGGISVGFGYDFQVLDRLPEEAHDQRVSLLVTDAGIFSPAQIVTG